MAFLAVIENSDALPTASKKYARPKSLERTPCLLCVIMV